MNWLQKTWQWLNTPTHEMKQFREWKRQIDDRTEGYRAALMANGADRDKSSRKPEWEHSRSWEQGYRDAQRLLNPDRQKDKQHDREPRERQPSKLETLLERSIEQARSRSQPERDSDRLRSHDHEFNRPPGVRGTVWTDRGEPDRSR